MIGYLCRVSRVRSCWASVIRRRILGREAVILMRSGRKMKNETAVLIKKHPAQQLHQVVCQGRGRPADYRRETFNGFMESLMWPPPIQVVSWQPGNTTHRNVALRNLPSVSS